MDETKIVAATLAAALLPLASQGADDAAKARKAVEIYDAVLTHLLLPRPTAAPVPNPP